MKKNVLWALTGCALILALSGCSNPTSSTPTPTGDPALGGSVSITGVVKVGVSATANIDALEGTGDISYQWETSGTETGTFAPVTANGTSASYTPVPDDSGTWLRVTVTRAGYTGSKSTARLSKCWPQTPPPPPLPALR